MNTPPPPPDEAAFALSDAGYKRVASDAAINDDSAFARDDLDRIVAETFVERVEYRPECVSTNSRARELAGDDPDAASCTLVLADRQTAGRGRGANRWWSAEGALTFSVLVRPERFRLPTRRWPQVSLTTGLAVCDAIDELLGDSTARLKWPNDVYLDGRKVCGVLVEATDGRKRRLVVGVGVNVNNSASAAPLDLREKAVALCDVIGHPVSRVEVLVAILRQLAAQLEILSTGSENLPEQWTRRCLLAGRRVEIELPLGRRSGICRGIDAEGALLVETDGGTERFVSGVIKHFD